MAVVTALWWNHCSLPLFSVNICTDSNISGDVSLSKCAFFFKRYTINDIALFQENQFRFLLYGVLRTTFIPLPPCNDSYHDYLHSIFIWMIACTVCVSVCVCVSTVYSNMYFEYILIVVSVWTEVVHILMLPLPENNPLQGGRKCILNYTIYTPTWLQ